MTLLLTACDEHGVAAAADSWTYQGDELENVDQVKVFALFDTFLVGTAGREYVHDFERYDFRLLREKKFAPDRWQPEKPRSEYLAHHLAGESSIAEVLIRWATLQAQNPGLVEKVQREPDVEEFHAAITDVMRTRYREESEFAHMVYERDGTLMPRNMPMKLVSLGYGPDDNAYNYLTTFLLKPLDFSDEASTINASSGAAPFPIAYASDVANETDWWVDDFASFVDRARAEHPPGKALGVALANTVEHCVSNQPSTPHPFGGRVRAGYVTRDGAEILGPSKPARAPAAAVPAKAGDLRITRAERKAHRKRRARLAGETAARRGDRVLNAEPEDAAIGRNDPCWCGSGKRYKRCHGA